MSIPRLASALREWLAYRLPLHNGKPVQVLLVGGQPLEGEDQMVGLNLYPIVDNQTNYNQLTGLDVRMRNGINRRDGGNLGLLEMQDTIYGLLGQIQAPMQFGDVTVSTAWRQISTRPFPDAQGRPEVVDTYYIRHNRP